jgi:hypothetical protein
MAKAAAELGGRAAQLPTWPGSAYGNEMPKAAVSNAARQRLFDHLVARASGIGEKEAKSCGPSEGSPRIALCRIELYIWSKHARARDKVCFQTDAVGVLEQHRIVAWYPCPL